MKTYTLSNSEAALYDSDDDQNARELLSNLESRFGDVNPFEGNVEVLHPDGFVINTFGPSND